jgi:3-oxoacyl-[acyl-carrier protein] reductase
MTEVLGEKLQEEVLKIIPLKDMGNPDEIANLALFLASPDARYITGQVIAIDGGMTM